MLMPLEQWILLSALKASPDFAGIKVSPLLVMVKAMIWAVQRNPTVNSTWTDEEIIVHHFVNMGVAAATPRGLIVPNVKDAHTLSLRDLAIALEQLTSLPVRARQSQRKCRGDHHNYEPWVPLGWTPERPS
jgi:pyruvate/2-oxoglutarate dehydrogenase complex dihydrolipoamide acyltransferase (E2) component